MYNFLEKIVGDFMTRGVKTVTEAVTMRELRNMFERDDFNAYPVENGARVTGLVTKFDFLKCFAFTQNQMVPRYDELMDRTAGDIMTPEFIYVQAETRLTRVLHLMVEHRFRSVPVIGGDRKLVGMISRNDVMRALG